MLLLTVCFCFVFVEVLPSLLEERLRHGVLVSQGRGVRDIEGDALTLSVLSLPEVHQAGHVQTRSVTHNLSRSELDRRQTLPHFSLASANTSNTLALKHHDFSDQFFKRSVGHSISLNGNS